MMWMISNRSTTDTGIYREIFVLQESQNASKNLMQNFGYCYRIGGDEFCVLLKNGGNEGRCKQEFLQRLQEKRGEIAFLPTVSYGSAPFSGEDIVKVKDRADQDMYQYKKERKNRKRLS